jgi:hypothetical protein
VPVRRRDWIANGMPYLSTAAWILKPRIFFPPSTPWSKAARRRTAGSTIDDHGAWLQGIPAGAPPVAPQPVEQPAQEAESGPAGEQSIQCAITRHCMPQKQTHQIAMTTLRKAAPASGGVGPDRSGRAPILCHPRVQPEVWLARPPAPDRSSLTLTGRGPAAAMCFSASRRTPCLPLICSP